MKNIFNLPLTLQDPFVCFRWAVISAFWIHHTVVFCIYFIVLLSFISCGKSWNWLILVGLQFIAQVFSWKLQAFSRLWSSKTVKSDRFCYCDCCLWEGRFLALPIPSYSQDHFSPNTFLTSWSFCINSRAKWNNSLMLRIHLFVSSLDESLFLPKYMELAEIYDPVYLRVRNTG